MATEKQIAANQLNAMKSTGPRTETGKDASSQNATKHGLTARKSVVLEDESEEEFITLRQSLRDYYTSSAPVQAMLVDALAAHLWRLQRVPKFEAMLLQSNIAQNENEGQGVDQAVGQLLALREFVLPKDVLGKISRHEAHLLREAQRLMTMLEGMKTAAPLSTPDRGPPLIEGHRHGTPPSPPVDDYQRILTGLSESRFIR